MALSLTVATLCSTSGAHPEVFGYHPVDSITAPADEHGEVEWSTADMLIGKGWRPTPYDEGMLRTLFEEPKEVAPDTIAWAFAYELAPDHGILLTPAGNGVVVAGRWNRGIAYFDRWRSGKRLTSRSGSAWLNALADFQRAVLHDPPEEP